MCWPALPCMSLPGCRARRRQAKVHDRAPCSSKFPRACPLTPPSYLDGTSIYYYWCRAATHRRGISARPPMPTCHYWQPSPCQRKCNTVLVLPIPNTTRPHDFSLRLVRKSGQLRAKCEAAAADFSWISVRGARSAVESCSGPNDQRQAHRERTEYPPKPPDLLHTPERSISSSPAPALPLLPSPGPSTSSEMGDGWAHGPVSGHHARKL